MSHPEFIFKVLTMTLHLKFAFPVTLFDLFYQPSSQTSLNSWLFLKRQKHPCLTIPALLFFLSEMFASCIHWAHFLTPFRYQLKWNLSEVSYSLYRKVTLIPPLLSLTWFIILLYSLLLDTICYLVILIWLNLLPDTLQGFAKYFFLNKYS